MQNIKGKQTLTCESLINAGYSVYKAPVGSNATNLYQKRIKDDFGTLYFINIYYYDFFESFKFPEYKRYYAFEAKMSFDTHDVGYLHITMQLDTEDNSLDIEDKLDLIWNKFISIRCDCEY